MADKFICDGCNHVFPRSEVGGERIIKTNAKVYGGGVITLIFCKDCWKERAEEKGDEDGET